MIIEAKALTKQFRRHEALRGLDLSVPEGAAYAFIGPNGAGKTTTIRVLLNILRASGGTARVLGTDSAQLGPRDLARIGYVSESQELPGWMTAGAFIAYLRPFYPTWDQGLEAEILGAMRLPLDRKIKDLSHGMRIKLALTCALAHRPKLLILDEPFSGLDALARDELLESLISQAGELTLLISSHELTEIEGLATHVGFISDGRMLFQDSMEDLSRRARAIHVTLSGPATLPEQAPREWLDVRAAGNVVSFLDTRFTDEALRLTVARHLPTANRIEVEPVPLRSIFTSIARAAREGRAA